MTVNDFIQYVWVPVMGYMWVELQSLKKKLESKASKEDIADYLDPRIAPLQDSVKQTHDMVEAQGARLDNLILTIMSWQSKQTAPK